MKPHNEAFIYLHDDKTLKVRILNNTCNNITTLAF